MLEYNCEKTCKPEKCKNKKCCVDLILTIRIISFILIIVRTIMLICEVKRC